MPKEEIFIPGHDSIDKISVIAEMTFVRLIWKEENQNRVEINLLH